MLDIPIHQQIFDAISRAKKILIPLPQEAGGDAAGAAFAMMRFLGKLEKDVQVISTKPLPERLRFLPGAESVRPNIEPSAGFVISVRTEDAPLDELSYHLDERTRKVNIFLKPSEGQYRPEDVTFRADSFPYDLIITLDVPSLDLLGPLYDTHTDLFFETPIVNIDHHPNNEHFGEINLVDVTATSSTEILFDLLEQFEKNLLDEKIATNLLTGIIVETNSFQHIKTTPKSFLRASNLIALGADQQEVTRHLFKTRSVGLLKLWGRSLARIREVPDLSLSYTLIKAEDISRSGSDDIEGVMRELILSLSDAKLIMLLAEQKPGEFAGLIFAASPLQPVEVAEITSGTLIAEGLVRFKPQGATIGEAEINTLKMLEPLKAKINPNT